MSGNKHISVKIVSFILHIQKFCCKCHCTECSVSIRYKTDSFRTGSDSSQTSQKSDSRCIAAFCFSVFARNTDFKHICASLRSHKLIYFYISIFFDPLKVFFDSLASYIRTVQYLISFNNLFHQHSFLSSCLFYLSR